VSIYILQYQTSTLPYCDLGTTFCCRVRGHSFIYSLFWLYPDFCLFGDRLPRSISLSAFGDKVSIEFCGRRRIWYLIRNWLTELYASCCTRGYLVSIALSSHLLSCLLFFLVAVPSGEILEFSDVCRHFLGRPGEIAAVVVSVVALLGGAIVYWVLMSNFLYNTVLFIYSK